MDNLSYLLSSYFHQDWDHYGPTWQHAVDAFLEDDPTTVAAVPDEIDDLLASSNEDLEQSLERLGNYYYPPEGDRAWLEAVRDRIKERATR